MLYVPNKLFYNSSVISQANESKTNHYLTWKMLSSNPSFPMIFYGVNGKHYHDIDSPSFYNLNEVSAVIEIVKSLMIDIPNLKTYQIGIIGGFRSQVLKIRESLRDINLATINVGSIEDYQGQEYDIIIISTVLTARVPNYEKNVSQLLKKCFEF